MLKCGNFEAFPKKYSKKGDGARFGTEGTRVPSKKHVRRRARTSRGRIGAEKRGASSREVLLGDRKVRLGTRMNAPENRTTASTRPWPNERAALALGPRHETRSDMIAAHVGLYSMCRHNGTNDTRMSSSAHAAPAGTHTAPTGHTAHMFYLGCT